MGDASTMRLTRACWLALALGCASNGGNVDLYVDVRADYLPGAQFAAVEALVLDTTQSARVMVTAADADSLLRGRRIADFEVPTGTVELLVRLVRMDGSVVQTRRTLLSLRADTGVTIVISQSCAGIVCPQLGDAPNATECVDGRCIPPDCDPTLDPTCGSSMRCVNRGQCTGALPVSCAYHDCVSMLCVIRYDDALCSGGRCDPAVGCIGSDGGTDGGFDAGRDAGVIECGMECDRPNPCELGRWSCAGEIPTCDAEGMQPLGSACAVGGMDGTCDNLGACIVGCFEGATCEVSPCVPGTEQCRNGMALCIPVGDGMPCEGTTCSDFGSCEGFAGECGQSGTQTRTCMDRVCMPTGCQVMTRMDSQGCSRTTDGMPCSGGQCSGGTCNAIASCPFLYSDDGHGYVYETEIAGTSLNGRGDEAIEPFALGRAFVPMEARLDRALVEGRELRALLLEGQSEITYLDEAHLTIVRHPAGHEVLSTTAVTGAVPDFVALPSASFRLAERAVDAEGKDVHAELERSDDVPAPQDPASLAHYDLDFGPDRHTGSQWLVIDGWRFKVDRGLGDAELDRWVRRPRVEVQGHDGRWRVVAELAFPRGDRKAALYDLRHVVWPRGRVAMRIVPGTDASGLSLWYFDRVRFNDGERASVETVTVAPSSADLRFFGAPTFEDRGNPAHPIWNVPDGLGVLEPATLTFGRFTRYGDVRPLVTSSDDRFVVMREGDGVELRFALPEWDGAQTFFFGTDLVYKPRICPGCFGPTPTSVEAAPLPFHEMSRYPAFRSEQPAIDQRAYDAEWNTRVYAPGDLRVGR